MKKHKNRFCSKDQKQSIENRCWDDSDTGISFKISVIKHVQGLKCKYGHN